MAIGICLISLALLFSTSVWAIPPIWEPVFGSEIVSLTGEDDDYDSVTLSFSFPFEGTNYTTVWVGTNGDIQLDTLGDDGDIDYDHWEYMEEFISDLDPSIAGLNTDLDLGTTGTIHFNDFGDRAVFTWNEVGTNANETALVTFQIQIEDTGRIVLGYNGVLDDPGEDLITDLDEGIVVGITDGLWPDNGTEPGLSDLSGSFSSASPNIYDRWCYDIANTCGFDGNDDGLPGPINTAFDLDQSNVVFTPVPGGGFDVSGTGGPGPAGGDSLSIPTLGQWGLILLTLMLAALGAGQYRRVYPD